ncbi:MAG: ABC transporter permease [Bacteroidales bacterium]|nr:ABC transporter permease [Bacteroidales bacterium]
MKDGNLTPKDFFRDILSSVRMSRRRSILSGIMTVWGVFIFIVIAGVANGTDRGNRSNYDYILKYGKITILPGRVSEPRMGLVKGRRITLTRSDAREALALFSNRAEYVFPRKRSSAAGESLTGSAGLTVSDFRKELDDKYLKIIAGRGFTRVELEGRRRICILPESVAVQLFGSPADAVGSILDINRLPYTVLGVYRTIHNVRIKDVFVPFETAMSMPGAGEELSSIDIKMFLGIPAEEKHLLRKDVESWFCFRKGIDPGDTSALCIEENIDFISDQEKFLGSMRKFTGIIGLLSLLMSILGVSSIVHLSVKERTKEIAVRLVCGSSKGSIFRLVLGESVMIMLIFGIVGMLLGSLALDAFNVVVDRINDGAKWVFLGDMTVSWQIISSCTALIIACGLVSGLAPARKATSVRINEAMNCE